MAPVRELSMEKADRTYFARRGDWQLQIAEGEGCYRWSATNAETGEKLDAEAVGLENAMVSAAQAVQADWGTLRWRREGDDE
jgi:hypothetical protein